MPAYIITLKSDATPADVKAVKDQVVSHGGEIDHEFTLMKGFSVKMPEVHPTSFAAHPQVEHVEKDQTVRTQ